MDGASELERVKLFDYLAKHITQIQY